MVKRISIIFLVMVSFFGYSQNLEPVKDRINYEDEYAECWKVFVTPEPSDVKRAFKSFLKDRYDVKLKGFGMFSNKDVLYAEDVVITKISTKRINFYLSVIDEEGLSEIKVFGNYGYSLYFNNDKQKDEFTALRSVLVEFLNSYLPEYYKEKVEDATEHYTKFVEEDEDLNKKIDDNKKEIEKLTKENEDLSKEIEKNKEEIKLSKENLVKNKEQLDKVTKELNAIKR